ncbi:relaxase domain-containing protein [Nonomuraea sp. KM90]|uniref:relaxase domain-containing protein n=1 Tax=Nonomuraea sp. KM90 TaxID=3457428 RepID=UPI003FCE77FB
MARVTALDSAAMVNQRLLSPHPGVGRDPAWIGSGLREVGLEAGAPLLAEQHPAAEALMERRHPLTGEPLVTAKVATHPRAKVAAEPLLKALQQTAAERATTVEAMLGEVPWAQERFARLVRGVRRERDRHRVPIADAERLAACAAVDVALAYDRDLLQAARASRRARVVVRNRGFDLGIDVPKSISVLYALADEQLAAAMEDALAAVEGWAGYGLRGQHGGGRWARRVPGTGLLGWARWTVAAWPVPGHVGDPFLGAHLVLANLVRGTDGRWSAMGAGGRDLYRHAHAAGALANARLRRLLSERHGIAWSRRPGTSAREIAGVPEPLRILFSKRYRQASAAVAEALAAAGPDGRLSFKQRDRSSLWSREYGDGVASPLENLRASWRDQARAIGYNPRSVARSCLGALDGMLARPAPADIAPRMWQRAAPRTSSTSGFSRAEAMALVLGEVPDGVDGAADAAALTEQVLLGSGAIELPAREGDHLSNSQRYAWPWRHAVLSGRTEDVSAPKACEESGITCLMIGQASLVSSEMCASATGRTAVFAASVRRTSL